MLFIFYHPPRLETLTEIENKKIRIGGMVKDNSIVIDSENISFVITDFKNEINVNYSGLVPNLFKEGKRCCCRRFFKR